MSDGASAVLLLARSATTGAALKDMQRLRDQAAGLPGVGPVVFAFAEEGTPSLPEGTSYGGVDEAGMDRIVDRRLLQGEIVEELAYRPSGADASKVAAKRF